MRLFAITCYKQIEDIFSDYRYRTALKLAEQMAGGPVPEVDRVKVENGVFDAYDQLDFDEVFENYSGGPALLLSGEFTLPLAESMSYLVGCAEYRPDAFDGFSEELFRDQIGILRDIFGNPFRPLAFAPGWLTETAVGIARGIYDDRAFDRLPILADALQDAGCENADVLAHCRGEGLHVRGCWVVGGVLRKG